MVCNISPNYNEITSSIHKNLYFLVVKNYHKLLLSKNLFDFCLTMISIRLFHLCYLYNNSIKSSFFNPISYTRLFLYCASLYLGLLR